MSLNSFHKLVEILKEDLEREDVRDGRGDAAKVEKYDNFNFYGSQLRIRIEMAFGLFQQKWGLLQRPLVVRVDKVKHLIQTIARLHNFSISERLIEKCEIFPTSADIESALIYNTHSQVHTANHTPVDDPNALAMRSLKGQSVLREEMAMNVEKLQMTRPKKKNRHPSQN
jgi:hypothetical protein